jgi:hypothetical protein
MFIVLFIGYRRRRRRKKLEGGAIGRGKIAGFANICSIDAVSISEIIVLTANYVRNIYGNRYRVHMKNLSAIYTEICRAGKIRDCMS